MWQKGGGRRQKGGGLGGRKVRGLGSRKGGLRRQKGGA